MRAGFLFPHTELISDSSSTYIEFVLNEEGLCRHFMLNASRTKKPKLCSRVCVAVRSRWKMLRG